jgi:hypothetical protein
MATLSASTGAGITRHDDSCTITLYQQKFISEFQHRGYRGIRDTSVRDKMHDSGHWLGVGVSVYDSVARHERDGMDA